MSNNQVLRPTEAAQRKTRVILDAEGELALYKAYMRSRKPMKALAAEFGISRSSAYNIINRLKEEGAAPTDGPSDTSCEACDSTSVPEAA